MRDTEKYYKDIEAKFDTSKYPDDHEGIKQRVNQNVIGVMKDESSKSKIIKFVGL